ncbi:MULTISPECIES: 16S rRNA (cytosine(1402)-N(4))-methyltransferase RsmH [Idiomarinaceae]|uniref:Ribosomal RNA small subunit methyltransferase H n=2 Tax=Pseudidiomarina TaxID=2800384 RepID=A0A368UTJ5_9GAMM|nr:MULTISPECIES: 16S rRNA (cytosine(1402)-N(4))-methyltransferase RsmH [Idiomarinaceae]MRJ41983.1 16S rRNA (cytosine(1402)-N(4))-methyltransferase RsmH [Idiomarina sp. FeN1]NCU57266.1 16S rRNA (cytosine(1402)-N(4))-methyltransferase RsmH [Idiomarina sp. FenA--70]NCU59974.1 16S rRNA (cytosine(1402)-N(4))-methyltransferase RsmH [Idiomarina sp. FenBw--71]PWW13013.1 16S rRNA (cytosine1402-N4)-methyltransferase [Pseudidiomarina maritima]RBP90453.1 16S rRNA (cytosine1402-N4)-methyltransferase [Pseud
MTTEAAQHVSVLLQESLDALAIKPDGTYLDATFGRGGHSRAILAQLNSNGRLFALDRDPTAIAAAAALQQDPRFTIIHTPFSQLSEVLDAQQLRGQLDGILFDLGVSSPQLDDAERGFSFMREGPLDMRMDTTQGTTAAEFLAAASADEIAFVLREYGEERFAWRIAQAIVKQREQQPLTTTRELAELIAAAVPFKDKHKHPATRSFQGIRIHINGELDEIEQALTAAVGGLKVDGRLAVISFHSLEDRLVKRFMRAQAQGKAIPANLPIRDADFDRGQTLRLVGKAIKPSAAEIKANPRARSSVLRIAARLDYES